MVTSIQNLELKSIVERTNMPSKMVSLSARMSQISATEEEAPVEEKPNPNQKNNEEFFKRIGELSPLTHQEIVKLMASMRSEDGKPLFSSLFEQLDALAYVRQQWGETSADKVKIIAETQAIVYAMSNARNDMIQKAIFPSEENGGKPVKWSDDDEWKDF